MKVTLGDGWEDVDDVFSDIQKVAEGDDLVDILEAGANIAYDYAYGLVPVDTGNLQSSIAVVREKDSVSLEVNADYAEDIEFGTPVMEAQPYIRPALSRKDEITGAMIDELQRKQNEVSR